MGGRAGRPAVIPRTDSTGKIQRYASSPFNQADTDQSDRDDEREAPKIQPPRTPEEKAARMKSFRLRTISTVSMIACFLVIIYEGHVPLMALVFSLQILMVRELFTLVSDARQEQRLPQFRMLQWWFCFAAAFYLYLRFITNNLLVELSSVRILSRLFSWILRSHTMLSFLLYISGFVAFVLSLKRGHYMYQFSQYAWTHMILLIVFVPSTFFVSSIFEGIIWFILPALLIVANDIFAYLAGFFWGRTPLIRLSPKKTWEGFIGGFLGTIVFAYILAGVMSHFQWMTCPRRDLSIKSWLYCETEDLFVPRWYRLADVLTVLPPGVADALTRLGQKLHPWLLKALGLIALHARPMQLHAVVYATFASVIAPFGGFFASGFKRAFKMKDFGDTIPGHGGITDRFDCQVLMAMFSYLYYRNFLSKPEMSVGDALSTALKLDGPDQLELFIKLGNMLAGADLLPDKLMDSISAYYFDYLRTGGRLTSSSQQ